MRYYVIAGEASGDLHGSNLLKAISAKDAKSDFRIWGGELMESEGGELVKHYKDLAFMGFIEVVLNLKTILGNISFCKKDILAYEPDALILIDYPGFNLRIAKWAKEKGIKVIYYISPQIWAWNAKRVHKIKRSVDLMLTILPFEKAFYQQYDYDVSFVGHPLLDVTKGFETSLDFKSKNGLSDKPIIALLPGSRKQEITKMLSVMLEVTPHFPSYQFVIAGAPSQEIAFYKSILAEAKQSETIQIITGQTYDLLNQSQAALVTSGTATLETALFKIPQVVCYIGSPISYRIAKRLIKVKFISLVNLILDRALVTELIQDACNAENMQVELALILEGVPRENMLDGYDELAEKLGNTGASNKAADEIVSFLEN